MTAGKLGRRPPTGAPAIRFGAHLAASPAAPIVDVAPRLAFGMDLNDRYGCCVVAALDHALETIDTTLVGSYVPMTDEQIEADYRSQNPSFDPATGAGDDGMVIQDYLGWLVKQGRILAFARIDHSNPAEMDAAAWLGLAVVTGETLSQQQMQTDTTWDWTPGEPSVGGHATVTIGYPGADRDTAVTWGTTVDMTETFVANAVEEAWFVLTQAHVDNPTFRGCVDVASFAAEFKQLTGTDLPVVAPPTPPPLPPPAEPDDALAAVAHPWVNQRHTGRNRLMAAALKAWLTAKDL